MFLVAAAVPFNPSSVSILVKHIEKGLMQERKDLAGEREAVKLSMKARMLAPFYFVCYAWTN